jgi:hypothetical protein
VLSEDEDDDNSDDHDYAPEPEQATAASSTPSPKLVRAQGPCDPDVKAACLELCISLLDHKLHGKLTDSIMVGFLAAHGIDRNKKGFKEAVAYTTDLSALVKIAQLMVVQYAVKQCEAGRAPYPNELVAEYQDRFMCYGSETPMNWILNLRAYGAKIRDTSTALGHMYWSDDGEKLSYKTIELTMNNFRWFLRDQVQEVQEQLHALLLLPDCEPEMRASYIPHLRLASLKDDPSVGTAGWSFLQDQRNGGLLGDRQRWLLGRVRDDKRLRRRFFANVDTLEWNKKHVATYGSRAYAFLRRLLLLIHMTGGQPARATELLTVRWRNSKDGLVRSLFVENGLVLFITSYHKNYSMSSATKIIYRYLPVEVSELVVYYVWLVAPFLEQLSILTPVPNIGPIGSLLWPSTLTGETKLKKKGRQGAVALPGHEEEAMESQQPEKAWESKELGQIIAAEFKRGLETDANIMLWRHSAIGISRRHLPDKHKFKRDYSVDEGSTAMDLQAAHTSRMASISYAREGRDGPGQLFLLRHEYREISRAWHSCLGFGVPLAPRNSVLQEVRNVNSMLGTKRGHNAGKAEGDELEQWLRSDATMAVGKRVKRQRVTGPAAYADNDWEY